MVILHNLLFHIVQVRLLYLFIYLPSGWNTAQNVILRTKCADIHGRKKTMHDIDFLLFLLLNNAQPLKPN